MRNNQPITQKEFVVRKDCAIISHTDASGNITYVNDEFVEYAGFSRAQLIGQPHNVIRHPDMPKPALFMSSKKYDPAPSSRCSSAHSPAQA